MMTSSLRHRTYSKYDISYFTPFLKICSVLYPFFENMFHFVTFCSFLFLPLQKDENKWKNILKNCLIIMLIFLIHKLIENSLTPYLLLLTSYFLFLLPTSFFFSLDKNDIIYRKNHLLLFTPAGVTIYSFFFFEDFSRGGKIFTILKNFHR